MPRSRELQLTADGAAAASSPPAAADVLSAVFDAARVGLCLLDPDGNVVRANEEWLRSGGFDRETALGRHIWDLFPQAPDSLRRLHDVARAGRTVAVPRHALPLRGREAWYEGWVAPVPLPGGTGLLVTALDVTDRKLTEDALRESEQRLRSDVAVRREAEDELRRAVERYERQVRLFEGVASTTPDFVYLFDRQGRFLYANRRLLEVWGMQLPDVVGRTCRELGYEQWHHDMHMREIAQVIATKRAIKGEVPFQAPRTGVFGVYEYIFTPVLGPDGDVEIVAGTTRDITERKRAEEQLRESDRRKDEFLAMLSHELRNPLAPIRNSVQILRDAEPGGEQARRAQDVIDRQAAHLARLVDDLLDVTRIARGKIELRRARLDLRDLVLRTADDFRAAMDARGVAFHLEVPAATVWVEADATRIAQAVGNLLHNAVKFSRAGDEVTLALRAGADAAEISVRDTGVGIDAELLPSVFDAFVQGSRTLARSEGGLGLGLALVKGIVELHGGTVRAASAGIDQGAELEVRLPLAPAIAAEEPARRDAGGGKERRRVLVVDDNRDAAMSLAELLSLRGHAADVAFDGPSAVEKARDGAPDVVLCDIGLPGMSGYEVARALRAAGRPVRLVALTGYAQAEDVRAAVDAGFDSHLAKPCDPDDVERLLG